QGPPRRGSSGWVDQAGVPQPQPVVQPSVPRIGVVAAMQTPFVDFRDRKQIRMPGTTALPGGDV
ncbi:hypothetical protein, partial [Pseudonocardia alaniniphila]|uniref:hypothetical protein n=1 Tax=Pseudonocardia alaniniphila TaxID=75291 RepID=UPI0031DD41B2